MAAKKVSRTTTKKLKDKWRAKQWYAIHAPDMFDSKEIPGTPADDPSKLKDRVVEVTMQELTGDFSKSYIKLRLRINRIAGFDAYTNFVGHEFTSDYIRRLTRRRRTKIDGVFDVTTKDGFRIRVKPMAIAEHRIQSSQKAAIRQQMWDVVDRLAADQRMGEFVRSMISGDVSRDIFRNCKSIYRLKRIDIRKSEVLGQLSSHRAVEDEPEDIDAIPEVPEQFEDIDAIIEDREPPVDVDGTTGEASETAPEEVGEGGAGEGMPPTEEEPVEAGEVPIPGVEVSLPAEDAHQEIEEQKREEAPDPSDGIVRAYDAIPAESGAGEDGNPDGPDANMVAGGEGKEPAEGETESNEETKEPEEGATESSEGMKEPEEGEG